MYKYYNAHPKGFWIDDCVDRAIAVTTRMDYADVVNARTAYKKSELSRASYSAGDPRRYIEEGLGAKKFVFSRRGPWKMTADRFSKTYKSGRYILDMGWHFAACVGGVLLDTWDPGDEIVQAAYLIEPVNETQKITLRFCYTKRRLDDGMVGITFYDGNGRTSAKTLSESDADAYVESLEKRGYPDMTDAAEWL